MKKIPPLMLHLLQVFLILLVLLMAYLSYQKVRNDTESLMLRLKGKTISSLEESFGYAIHYDEISPSFLTFLEIRNFRLSDPDSGEDLLEIRKLKLFYNPLFLLLKKEGTVPISNINATGVSLYYEEDRDSRLFSRLSSRSGSTGRDSPPVDISQIFSGRIRIRSWELIYSGSDFHLHSGGNTITLRQVDDYIRVKMNGDVSLKQKVPGSSLEYLELSADLSGNIQNSLQGFNLNGDFRHFKSNLLDISRQRFNIRYSDAGFRITKIQDSQPYDLSMVLNDQQVAVDFHAEGFSPDNVIFLKGRLAEVSPWLSTVFTGAAHFEMDRETGGLFYTYDGTAYIRNEHLSFPVNLSMDISGDENTLHTESFRASSPYGNLSYSGEWPFRSGYPVGSLALSGVPVGEGVNISGNFDLSTIDEYFYVLSRSLELNNGWNPGTVKMLVSRKEDSFAVSVRGDLNPDNAYKDQLLLNGEFSLRGGFQLDSSFTVNELSTESLVPFFPGQKDLLESEFLKSLLVETDGGLTLDKGSLYVRLNSLQAESLSGDKFLKSRGFFSPKEFDLYSLEAGWDQNYLLGSLHGTISSGDVSVNSSWNLNDNPYLINGVYSNSQLSFVGNYGLRGQLLREPGSGFLATIKTEDYPLIWDGRSFLASLNIRGRYRPDSWEVYMNDSDIQWTNSDILSHPEVSLTAYMAPGVVNLFSLRYKDDYSQLRGSGSLSYDLNQEIFNGSFSMHEDNPDSFSETYSLYCVYNGENISSTLLLENALMDRFSLLNMEGMVNAEVTMEGSLSSPVVEGRIATDQLVMNNNQVGLRGQFRLDSDKVEVYDLNMSRNSVTLSRGLGFLNFQDGSIMMTSRLSSQGSGEDSRRKTAHIESGLTVMIDTGESVELRNLSDLKDRNFEGRLRIHPIKWNDLTTYPSRVIEFSRQGSLFEGQLLSDKTQHFAYDGETRDIELIMGKAFPVSFRMNGNLSPEALNVGIEDLSIDLNLINYFMWKDKAIDSRIVVFRENSLMEGRIHIGGTFRNPDFTGSLASRNLLLLTPYTEQRIGETDLRFQLLGSRVETNEFVIPIAEGELVSHGYMNLNGWSISDYSLDISSRGQPGTPVSYNAYGLRGYGAFTGDLRLYGTNQQGALEGTVVFNELVGSLGTKTEVRKMGRSSRYPFLLDLKFVTGRNDVFILPNPQLEIVRATAEQGQALNLNMDTGNSTLSMTGTVSIRNGEINYFDRSFRMTEGSLTFNETEDSFNPFLNLEAEIDTTNIDGDDVTVYLSYRNPVLNEFTPSLRTEPAMSEDQIMALFGQSLIPYDTEDVDLSTLVTATGGMVSQSGLVEPFESALKDSLNLDNVTIKTAILENALLNQLDGAENYSGTESSYNLGRYLDNTSIYLGQFLGDYLFLSAGLLVDYDELSGVGSYTGGMSLVPDLTLEMRTPFFLVAWNYSPDNVSDDIENGFVPRNSISLEWQFSY